MTPASPLATVPPSAAHLGPAVLELDGVRATALNALRLFAEAVVVPTALLAVLLHLVGMVPGVAAALGWVALTVVVRWVGGRRVPSMIFVCGGLLGLQAVTLLLSASALLYLLQPALGSALMAVVFLGSALAGRPVTARLARDFVDLPEHVTGRAGVRRMFSQVALLFGLSRLADAALSLSLARSSLETGLLARGFGGPALTLLTVAACAWWGWRCLRRDGVSIRLRPVLAPTAAAPTARPPAAAAPTA